LPLLLTTATLYLLLSCHKAIEGPQQQHGNLSNAYNMLYVFYLLSHFYQEYMRKKLLWFLFRDEKLRLTGFKVWFLFAHPVSECIGIQMCVG
jgi:hypothetical protein